MTSTDAPTPAAAVRGRAFAPLGVSAFRLLWIAGLVSNIGTWMQSVGAQWQLVDSGASAAVVALVQTASAAPVLLLALPAGVIGEFLNRRSVLLVTQLVQLAASLVLVGLSATGHLPPETLLAVTFVLGCAAAVQLPASQAIVADIVPTAMIRDAASLSSISVNVARAVGPAAAGLLIAQLGVTAVFVANALSFTVYAGALLIWKTYRAPDTRPEPFIDATRAGLRYVFHSRIVRSLYLRLILFLLPANALWALLPVLAQTSLGLGAAGYGLLLAALGIGSVSGALLLAPLRARIGANRVLLISMALFGIALCAFLLDADLWVIGIAMIVAGAGWIGVIATVNGVVQAFLPTWVRTRGLSIYQLALFGGTAVGSALSGALAAPLGAGAVVVGAGVMIVVLALVQIFVPARIPEGIGRGIVDLDDVASEAPPAVPDHENRVLVVVQYTVPAADRAEFLRLMGLVSQTRYRTGARTWHLYGATESPEDIREAYTLGSWREHLDQLHRRHTQWDADLLAKAEKLSTTPLKVTEELELIIPRPRREPRRPDTASVDATTIDPPASGSTPPAAPGVQD
nr:MFS transporter [uncultured Microbacterium sp.]